MKKITKKQEEVYDFILDQIEKFNRPPTILEIKQNFSYSSNQAVVDHLTALEKKGYIKRQSKSRGIIPLKTRLDFPIVGQIAAGNPVLAEENIDGALSLNTFFDSDDSYVLRVNGHSMKDAGIFDNDFVIVKYQDRVNNGEIGVAVIDDEATVKRIYYENDRVILKPENDEFDPIIVEKYSNFRICGKVVGLLRNMKL